MLQLKIVLAKQSICSIAHCGQEERKAIEVSPRFENKAGEFLTPAEIMEQKKNISWEHVDKVVASYVSAALHSNNISKDEIIFIKLSRDTMEDDDVFENWVKIFASNTPRLENPLVTVLSACTDKEILKKRWEVLNKLNIELGIHGFDCREDLDSLDMVKSFDWDWAKFKVATHSDFKAFDAIEYCRKNNIKIVVESIENKGQEVLASVMGADLVQGYLYGKPEPFYLETNLKHVQS